MSGEIKIAMGEFHDDNSKPNLAVDLLPVARTTAKVYGVIG